MMVHRYRVKKVHLLIPSEENETAILALLRVAPPDYSMLLQLKNAILSDFQVACGILSQFHCLESTRNHHPSRFIYQQTLLQ